MSESVTIKVEGLEELKQRLDFLDANLALSMQRAGSRAAAKVILGAQQETVPFDTGALEGELEIQRKGERVLVGPNRRLNYIGRFHEFGTKFMAGIHWMQKAWDSSSGDALEAYINKVRQMLNRHEYRELMATINEELDNSADSVLGGK